MGWESYGLVRFDLGPLFQGQWWTVKLKSAYNLFIIGPRGLQCETNLQEILGWESSDVVRFDLGALLQGQTRRGKVKSAYNPLVIGPRGLQCETNLYEIMGWETSRSNDGSLALVSCLSGGYKFASLHQCAMSS